MNDTPTIDTVAVEQAIVRALGKRRDMIGRNPDARVHLLSGGILLMEAAADIDNGEGMGRCCATQEPTGPLWAWVDRGRVIGAWNAQCGGCGSQGAGSVYVDIELDIDTPDQEHAIEDAIFSLVEDLACEVSDIDADTVACLLARCQHDVDEVAERLAAGLDWDEATGYVRVGSMHTPGVCIIDGRLVCWDYDPRSTDGAIIEAEGMVPDDILEAVQA